MYVVVINDLMDYWIYEYDLVVYYTDEKYWRFPISNEKSVKKTPHFMQKISSLSKKKIKIGLSHL